MQGLFNTVSSVINFISTLIKFIASIITIVQSLFVSFFVSMPSFISVGLLLVFSLGITILVIKVIR